VKGRECISDLIRGARPARVRRMAANHALPPSFETSRKLLRMRTVSSLPYPEGSSAAARLDAGAGLRSLFRLSYRATTPKVPQTKTQARSGERMSIARTGKPCRYGARAARAKTRGDAVSSTNSRAAQDTAWPSATS